jgi:hypothetical protein
MFPFVAWVFCAESEEFKKCKVSPSFSADDTVGPAESSTGGTDQRHPAAAGVVAGAPPGLVAPRGEWSHQHARPALTDRVHAAQPQDRDRVAAAGGPGLATPLQDQVGQYRHASTRHHHHFSHEGQPECVCLTTPGMG